MTQNKQSLKDKIKQELNASKQFADKKLDEAKEISKERALELKGLIEAVRVQAA